MAVLHAKYYPHVKHYVACRVNGIADLEDLAQDVFVQICKEDKRYGEATIFPRRYLRHHNVYFEYKSPDHFRVCSLGVSINEKEIGR